MHPFDFGLRRVRFLAFGEISDKTLILFHAGINNQTFKGPGSRKPSLFVHDAWTEFKLVDDKQTALYIGGGLHYWHGVSRLTNASTLNFLAIDAPITNWPVIERSDQFARQMGIFAKGIFASGVIDYRIALNRPFTASDTLAEENGQLVNNQPSVYNNSNNTFSSAGYAKIQLWDKESHTLPYTVGTYIGKKKIFNLGAGYYWHPESMQSTNNQGQLNTHDTLLLGADIFLDTPIGTNGEAGAITALLTGYLFDFGPNHLRNIGIMNIGDPGSGRNLVQPSNPSQGRYFNGQGNAYPVIGTGSSYYMQLGYLLALPKLKLQPYFTAQLNAFEQLDDPALIFGMGANLFLIGHHAKLTIHWRNRPIYTQRIDDQIVTEDRANEFIFQSMVFL